MPFIFARRVGQTIHVYRQNQVQRPTGNEVKWAECSLIIGTGYQVHVFCLILDSSVGLWVGIQSAGDLLPWFEPWIQQRKTTYLLSIRKWLTCARASKLTTHMYVCIPTDTDVMFFRSCDAHADVWHATSFRTTGPLCVVPTFPEGFPDKEPVIRSFAVSAVLRLNNVWTNRITGDLRRPDAHVTSLQWGSISTQNVWFSDSTVHPLTLWPIRSTIQDQWTDDSLVPLMHKYMTNEPWLNL